MKRIYLDYGATTPMKPEVLEAMMPYFKNKFGNASSLHSFGDEAKEAVDESRATIAQYFNADPEEIIFTASATEADNLATMGIALANKDKGKHIITVNIEHKSVLSVCQYLESVGFDVTYLSTDKYGLINVKDLENAIRPDTILISIAHANAEIGTIQPIEKIGKIARENGVMFHTDAVQSVPLIPIDVKKMNIDLLSLSGHKMYGPKGIGALYIKKGIKAQPIVRGGGHEKGLRSSTQNVPAIVGFAKAVELIAKDINKREPERLTKLRDQLIKGTLKIKNTYLTGHPTKRLPNNASFWFKSIEGESLILLLNSKGIAASTGSACSSKSLTPSHVLTSIGLKPEEAHGSLRLTIGKYTKEEDIDYVLKILPEEVKKLREISPFK